LNLKLSHDIDCPHHYPKQDSPKQLKEIKKMTKYFRNSIIVYGLLLVAIPSFTIQAGAKGAKGVTEDFPISSASKRSIGGSIDPSNQQGSRNVNRDMEEETTLIAVRKTLNELTELDNARRELAYNLVKKNYRYLAERKAADQSILGKSSFKYSQTLAFRNVAYDSCGDFFNSLYEFYSLSGSCAGCGQFCPGCCIDCIRSYFVAMEMIENYIACVGSLQ
jgi:hypothetical protein